LNAAGAVAVEGSQAYVMESGRIVLFDPGGALLGDEKV
jgi:hypothetical protein